MTVFIRWVELILLDQPMLTILVVLISTFLITLSWIWNSARSEIRRIDHFPNLFGIFVRALIGFAAKSRTFPTTLHQIPSLQIALDRSVSVDMRRLNKFRALVGDDSTDSVPPMFLIVESFRLCLYLLTHPSFPVSTIGAVLSTHSFKVLIPCTPNTKLKFKCQVGPEIRRTDKGHVEVDFVNEAITEDNQLTWKSTTTVILVNPASRSQPRQAKSVQSEDVPGELIGSLKLPEDCGRKYGALNGDLNPIHLWKWTSWIFGFKRPIAHALYLTTLSLLEIQKKKSVRPVRSLSVEFRRPTLLPAKLLVLYTEEQDHSTEAKTTYHHFCLASEDRKKKVLVGTILTT